MIRLSHGLLLLSAVGVVQPTYAIPETVEICEGLESHENPYKLITILLSDLDTYMSDSTNYNKVYQNTYPHKEVYVDGKVATLGADCVPYYTGDDVSCPDSEPSLHDACVFTEVCDYGQETCCNGVSYPVKVATCFNGMVSLADHDGCKDVNCNACPKDQPNFGDYCSFSGTCEYGEEECCGVTHPEMAMTCDGGMVQGIFLHHCQNPQCDTDEGDSHGVASSFGDPHFKTWSGEQFDFHGGCDLVLFEKPDFANGLGLDVHIRTQVETWWSYIEVAAIRVGDHTIEIMAGKDTFQYWIDGDRNTALEGGEKLAFGEYVLTKKVIADHQVRFRLDLGDGDAISIESYKKFVRVSFKLKTERKFDGGLGMLGSHPDGKKIARDGETLIEDSDEFGQEWQVLASEPKLFHGDGVHPPMKCVMPSDVTRSQGRRLGESMLSREDAELACSRVWEADRDACVFDVLATNDVDTVGSYSSS